MDNRPLKLAEFEERVDQIIYMSATPGVYEQERTDTVVRSPNNIPFHATFQYRRSFVVLSVGPLMNQLIDVQFERNDIDFQRGRFRVRGDVVEIFPASRDEQDISIT